MLSQLCSAKDSGLSFPVLSTLPLTRSLHVPSELERYRQATDTKVGMDAGADVFGGHSGLVSHPTVAPSLTPMSSELTVFFAGSVNVYNDVPADKAHAIMLLLENCTKQIISRQNISRETNIACNMDANIAQKSAHLGTRTSNGETTALSPSFLSTSSLDFKKPFSRFVRALSPSSQTLQTERRPLQFINKRTQADLPFARKASLARFLEKRTARVHSQEKALGPGGDANAANKKTKICDDKVCS